MNKTIIVTISEGVFKKGDILCYGVPNAGEVVWCYRYRWWKKVLNFLGFNISKEERIKIKLL